MLQKILVVSVVLIIIHFSLASAVSDITHTNETLPDTTLPNETLPDTTLPDIILPNEILSNETIPNETLPNETIPNATLPNSTLPNTTLNSTLPIITLSNTTNSTLPIITLSNTTNSTLTNATLPILNSLNQTIIAENDSIPFNDSMLNYSMLNDSETQSSQELTDISPPTPIAAPVLDQTTLDTLTRLSAKLVNSTASVDITSLPQIIVSGISNTNGIIATKNSQSSISLDTSFPPLTNGSEIINAINLPIYTLTNSTLVTAIIPTIVTTANPTSGYVVATPPLDGIIAGQQMIITIQQSLVPSFGGLKEIDVQSSPDVTTGTTGTTEWFVAQIDNKIPSSIPQIHGTLVLFVNIQYPFEDNGIGFNWADPANHAKPPTLVLIINKTSSGIIEKDYQGCPILDAYTLSAGAWTGNGLGEIASSSISQTQCQVKIQSQHLSKFAFSLRHVSALQGSGPGLFGVGTVVSDNSGLFDSTSASLALDNGTISRAAALGSLLDTITRFYKAIADPAQGFSNVECSQGSGYALMTGQYTSGDVSEKVVFLKMSLLDSAGHVLNTGNGHVSDIDAHKTKSFNAIARFNDNFTSCTVQVDTTIPK